MESFQREQFQSPPSGLTPQRNPSHEAEFIQPVSHIQPAHKGVGKVIGMKVPIWLVAIGALILVVVIIAAIALFLKTRALNGKIAELENEKKLIVERYNRSLVKKENPLKTPVEKIDPSKEKEDQIAKETQEANSAREGIVAKTHDELDDF
jgi:hypothetical protein